MEGSMAGNVLSSERPGGVPDFEYTSQFASRDASRTRGQLSGIASELSPSRESPFARAIICNLNFLQAARPKYTNSFYRFAKYTFRDMLLAAFRAPAASNMR